jgi:hypothetical protein
MKCQRDVVIASYVQIANHRDRLMRTINDLQRQLDMTQSKLHWLITCNLDRRIDELKAEGKHHG